MSSLLLSSASTAFALPPGEAGRGFVDGANHHLGDASFVQRFGLPPGDDDAEATRMKTHLVHVRALLGAGAATRPELAARRAELLGYLDDYIAKGITPTNMDRPWRTPVFVDALGNVCAVGYLIERSVGRELVERIADRHRFDYLEDIALPEVAGWIAESGFTLDELASIQPGYMAPVIETWFVWDPADGRPSDGPWQVEMSGVTTRGAWKRGHMQGPWSRSDANGKVIGRGDFERGRGTWTSLAGDGRRIAEGPFVKSQPAGTWRFFHASGRLAAEGALRRGQREGRWTFYYDDERLTPIARGSFARGGRVSGKWHHFDAKGDELATTWQGPTVNYGEVLRMRVTPHGRSGLRHEIAEGNFGGDYQRIDALELAGQRLYVDDQDEAPVVYDADGRVLTKHGAQWQRSGCGWDPELQKAARAGQVERVRTLLRQIRTEERPALTTGVCPVEEPIDATKSALVERMMTLSLAVREPTPGFVRALIAGEAGEADETGGELAGDTDGDGDVDEVDAAANAYLDDLGKVIARSMIWYIEWPHVDGAFARVFATLPGHYAPGSLVGGESEQVLFSESEPPTLRVISALPRDGVGGNPPLVTFR